MSGSADYDPTGSPKPSTPPEPIHFAHERLTVYQSGLRFVVSVEEVVSQLNGGRKDLVDQLRRAATSIVLNIAEGAGEFSPQEKARFYRMARRSATESAAVLDVLQQLRLCPPGSLGDARQLLFEIVSMTTRMVRNIAEGTRDGVREEWGEYGEEPGSLSGELQGKSKSKGKGKGKGNGKEGGDADAALTAQGKGAHAAALARQGEGEGEGEGKGKGKGKGRGEGKGKGWEVGYA